jgi:hypothetical protein
MPPGVPEPVFRVGEAYMRYVEEVAAKRAVKLKAPVVLVGRVEGNRPIVADLSKV